MHNKAVFLVMVVFLSLSASAADKNWDNDAGDNIWSTPANWDPYGVPNSSHNVKILLPSTTDETIVANGTSAECKWLWIYSSDSSCALLTVNSGGTLTSAGDSQITLGGHSPPAKGRLDVYGTVLASTNMQICHVGVGECNIYPGGNLHVNWQMQIGGETAGILNINGGSAWCKHLGIGHDSGTAEMNINGGTMTIDDTTKVAEGSGSSVTIRLYEGLLNCKWAKKAVPDTGGSATITLYNGRMNIGGGGLHIGPNELIDIHDGELHFKGVDGSSGPAVVQQYEDAGLLVGYNGQGSIVSWWDPVEWEMVVTALPPQYKAHNPWPQDGGSIVTDNTQLSWSSGVDADSHDVYFGTDSADVGNAKRLTSDLSGDGSVDLTDLSTLVQAWLQPWAGGEHLNFIDFTVFSGDWLENSDEQFMDNQSETTFDTVNFAPAGLDVGRSYYWRIDEVGDPCTYKGDTWHFWVFEDSAWPQLLSWVESPWTNTNGGTLEPDSEDLSRPWQMKACINDTEQIFIGLMNTTAQSIDVNVSVSSDMPVDKSSVELLATGGIESRNNGNVLVNLFTPGQIASFDGNFPYRFTNTDIIGDFPVLHLAPNTPVRLWLRIKTMDESSQQHVEPGQYRIGFRATDGLNRLARTIDLEVLSITLTQPVLESVTYGGVNGNLYHHTTVDVGKDCGGYNYYTFYNMLGDMWEMRDELAEWAQSDPCGFQEAVNSAVDVYIANQTARGFTEDQILLEIRDEPHDERAEDWVAMAQGIKNYRPELKIIANPMADWSGATVTLEGTFELLDPYVSVWMPHVNNYEDAEIRTFLQNTGKPLWFYKNCAIQEARREGACRGFLRRAAWVSLKYNLEGLGFWSAYSPCNDPWDDFDHLPWDDNPDAAVVFPCNDPCEPPIATRNWEAWRETHEDASIYKLVEQALAQGLIPQQKVSQATSWLNNSPNTILGASEESFIDILDSVLSEAFYLLEGVY